MVGHRAKTERAAKLLAKRLRKRGLKTSIYKKKKGYGVSSTIKDSVSWEDYYLVSS